MSETIDQDLQTKTKRGICIFTVLFFNLFMIIVFLLH